MTLLPAKKTRWARMRALTDDLEPQVNTAALADLRGLRRKATEGNSCCGHN